MSVHKRPVLYSHEYCYLAMQTNRNICKQQYNTVMAAMRRSNAGGQKELAQRVDLLRMLKHGWEEPVST